MFPRGKFNFIVFFSNLKRFVFILMFNPLLIIRGQNAVGLFLNDGDFLLNKISFVDSRRILMHNFLQKPYITIKLKSSKISIDKDSVFGFVDSEGRNYRISGRRTYTILNPGESILIYFLQYRTGEPKYPEMTRVYFFSNNACSPLVPLTRSNLETYFAYNHKFIEFLELYFRSDFELTEFDNIHQKYKLNVLLDLSIKN